MTLSRLLLVLLVATPIARADVLVVDASGGGDFVSLADAVAAASDGDTLLLRDGQYLEEGPVVIDGKPLTLLGEWNGQFSSAVVIESGLLVRNLSPNEHVVLQNLRVLGRPSTALAEATPALKLENNDAHVRVQACQLIGGRGDHNSHPDGAPAVAADHSASTALIGSYPTGGDGQFSPDLGVVTGNGGPGVLVDVGQVLVSHGSARGGAGGGNIPGGWAQGGSGGAGISQLSGSVLLAGGGAVGGDGGISHFGGDGGTGLSLGSAGLVWLMGGSYTSGGQGGGSDVGPNGADGLDTDGAAADFGGSWRDFDVSSPLREGQAGLLVFDGERSETALVFVSLALHQIALPGYQGVLMLSPTALLGPFAIPLSITQEPGFMAPALPIGLDSLNVHLQPAFVGPGGTQLGPGRVLTLLDASF